MPKILIKKYPDLTGPLYHYKGEVVLRFSPSLWAYFREVAGDLLHVDGVTGTLKIIGGSKTDSLIGWAVKKDFERFLLGLGDFVRGDGYIEALREEIEELVIASKKEHREHLEDAGAVGHTAHSYVETLAKATMADDEMRRLEILAKFPEEPRALSCTVAALAFFSDHDLRFISSEQRVYSREWNVAGTMDGDVLMSSCGKPECPCSKVPPFVDARMVLDLKTSNGIWSSYFAQAAFYRKAKIEEFPECTYAGTVILRLGKEDDAFEPWFAMGEDSYQRHLLYFKRALDLKHSVEATEAEMKAVTDVLRDEEKARKAVEKEARLAKACKGSGTYKGVRAPKCNGGNPCETCLKIYAERQAQKA